MADLRGEQLKDSYQNLVTDSGSNLSGIQNGNGSDITARIVERGSNSDGDWVRWADGTQITFLRSQSYPANSDGFIQETLPAPFINNSYRSVGNNFRSSTSATVVAAGIIIGFRGTNKEPDIVEFAHRHIEGTSSTLDCQAEIISTGRWY